MIPRSGKLRNLGPAKGLTTSINEPEFGRDSDESAVFRTGIGDDGFKHWFQYSTEDHETVQLDDGPWDFDVNLPRSAQDASATYILGRLKPKGQAMFWTYINEDEPDHRTRLSTLPTDGTIDSVERFVYQGKSYVSCFINDPDTSSTFVSALSMDGSEQMSVSKDTEKRRRDQEVVVTDNNIFVYYYTFELGRALL